MTYDLSALGWTPELARAFADLDNADLQAARVATQHRGRFVLYAEEGELDAEPSGRLRHAAGPSGFPVVGDWVAARLEPGLALIEEVLPRRSVFARAGVDLTRLHGAVATEAIAANADLVLIVMAAHLDLNLRRLERFLAAAWESAAEPCVILTKTDLVQDVDALVELVRGAAPGARVIAVSNLTGEGVEEVRALIGPGRTAAFLGSSGVGKSSLVNGLLGEERQAVSGVRADGRGRHTTTRRELILLPGGGLVLDTPGMRLFTPAHDAGLDAAFADIEALAGACRFRDCRHEGEPGCAVARAAEAGAVPAERLAGYLKLRRELGRFETRDVPLAVAEKRRKWRNIDKAGHERMRQKHEGLD